MAYVSLADTPTELYHYTKRENLEKILDDGRIRRFGDRESWFCQSLDDMLELMKATVMQEGKPYIKVGGRIGYYPEFKPEDYVILKLIPRWQSGDWVRWMQEVPDDSPQEFKDAAYSFSMLKVGFRGDLKFQKDPEVIEVAVLLQQEMKQEAPVQSQSMKMSY